MNLKKLLRKIPDTQLIYVKQNARILHKGRAHETPQELFKKEVKIIFLTEGQCFVTHGVSVPYIEIIVGDSEKVKPPKDKPLTIEELKKMEGKSVWIVWVGGASWHVIKKVDDENYTVWLNDNHCVSVDLIKTEKVRCYTKEI